MPYIAILAAIMACHHPYVAMWDTAGWQVQSDHTAFRTALDSRGQYTEVTCRYVHHKLTHCIAIADDGRRVTITRAMIGSTESTE